MQSDPDKLLKKHEELTHSEGVTVRSHVQRPTDDGLVNTLMLDDYNVPFKYLRQRKYKNLTGQQVNLTYYPTTESVAGFEIEVMKVVRIKVN
ncbi:MAG: hypothetical protein V7707_17380 [Motiliproteus sp.]